MLSLPGKICLSELSEVKMKSCGEQPDLKHWLIEDFDNADSIPTSRINYVQSATVT